MSSGRRVVGGRRGRSGLRPTVRRGSPIGWRSAFTPSTASHNTVAAPLRTQAGVVGAIVLSRRTAEPWSSASLRILGGAAVEASAALARAYSHRAAEARASTDALTGPAEPPLLRRVLRPAGPTPPGGRRGRRADDRHRPLQAGQRSLRPSGRRPGAASGRRRRSPRPSATTTCRLGSAARSSRSCCATRAHEVAPRGRGARSRAPSRSLDLRAFGPGRVTVSVGVAVARTADQPISELARPGGPCALPRQADGPRPGDGRLASSRPFSIAAGPRPSCGATIGSMPRSRARPSPSADPDPHDSAAAELDGWPPPEAPGDDDAQRRPRPRSPPRAPTRRTPPTCTPPPPMPR